MESEEITGDLDSGDNIKKPMSLMLANPIARDWIHKRRENIRPWSAFVTANKFKPPQTSSRAYTRIIKNIEHFQSNYIFVFLGLILYCLITSPLLLIAVAASLGLCYIINIKNADNEIKLFGRSMTLAQQYGIVACISFPLFYLAGAGTAVFWVLGVSFVLIMLHAVMYRLDDEATDNETFEVITETV